jgi:2,3-bisphosphoglycerate-independent phosphoglycerate mutase
MAPLRWGGQRVPTFAEQHAQGTFIGESASCAGFAQAVGLETIEGGESADAPHDLASAWAGNERLGLATRSLVHQKATDAAGHTRPMLGAR